MHAGVFTLFATHFSALRQLEVLYPNVKLCQFAVNAGEGSFQCIWQLKAGAVDVPHYGLMLASDAGFPEEVTCQAIAIKQIQEAGLNPPAHLLYTSSLQGSMFYLTLKQACLPGFGEIIMRCYICHQNLPWSRMTRS